MENLLFYVPYCTIIPARTGTIPSRTGEVLTYHKTGHPSAHRHRLCRPFPNHSWRKRHSPSILCGRDRGQCCATNSDIGYPTDVWENIWDDESCPIFNILPNPPTFHLSLFIPLHRRQSIWRFSGTVLPPFDHGTM